jgi:hypothetical protein
MNLFLLPVGTILAFSLAPRKIHVLNSQTTQPLVSCQCILESAQTNRRQFVVNRMLFIVLLKLSLIITYRLINKLIDQLINRLVVSIERSVGNLVC